MKETCPMEWTVLQSMGPWCVPWDIPWHLPDSWSGPWRTTEQAMVHSIVPDGASLGISSMDPTYTLFPSYMSSLPMARSTESAMTFPMVGPMVTWHIP